MCYIKKADFSENSRDTCINSSRQKNALYGVMFTSCLFQKPSLGLTSLVRVLTQTNREYNLVRYTFYDVNYIHAHGQASSSMERVC